MKALEIFSGPYAMLARAGVIALVAVALFGYGWFKGNVHGTEKLTKYQSSQAAESTRINRAREIVTERVVNHYIKVAGETKVVTQTIENEVTKYVQANVDTGILSVAAVSLHNAAASNTISDPALSTDGTPSGVETASLTQTCAANYAEYHRVSNRLMGLQTWVSEQQKVK